MSLATDAGEVGGLEDRATASGLSPRLARLLALLPILVTGFGVLLAFWISWSRAFQVDEVETIHAAYDIATGKLIYRDFWQGHHPLLYLLLSSILPADAPVLAFKISRLFTFLMLLGTIAASGSLTRRLGGNAWLTSALLVIHSTFIERGMEVRPDAPMTLLLMIALWVGSLDRGSRIQRVGLQGVLLGLAFVTTQKAAIACLALGFVWLVMAIRYRDWRLVVFPCALWAVPISGLLALLFWLRAWDNFVLYNFIHPGQSIGGETGAASATFSPLPLLWLEWKRNVVFVVGGLFGIVAAPWLARRREAQPLLPVATVAAVWLGGLFVMPFPYPYSHVGGIPALAVLTGVGLPDLLRRRGSARGRDESTLVALVPVLVLLAAAATSLPRLLSEPARSNSVQLDLLERVHLLTRPGDRVFDLAGLYFREDAYPIYLMTSAHYVRYRHGGYPPIAAWLREHGLDLFLVNYRMRWLSGEDRRFLQSHFVRVEPNVFMSGSLLDGLPTNAEKVFEVTRAGDYRFEGDGRLWIDGVPFTRGRLQRGVHSLTSPTGIEKGRVVVARAPESQSQPTRDRRLFHPFD